MNFMKTSILLAAIGALFLGVGFMIGGQSGMLLALFLAFAMNFGFYWFGKNMALSMARARPLAKHEVPWLFEANERICKIAGIPEVPLYVSPDQQPNAFACGRGPGAAAVCFNVGLINGMTKDEVIGVLAHEIAHVRNRDTLLMTVAAAVGSAITYLAYIAMFFGRDEEGGPGIIGMLVIWLLGPIAAGMIQMAISRAREYEADASAARYLQTGEPLASALETLHRNVQLVPSQTAQPATAHMYIANPLSGGGIASLFSTHPPAEERVRRLRAMRFN